MSPALDHVLGSSRLLGDPLGARSRLESLGLYFRLYFNQQFGGKLRGGTRSGDLYRTSGSYDFITAADLGELGLLDGMGLLLQVKGNYHRNINPDVEALSDPIDDADFGEPIWVVQLWAQQRLFGDRLRIRAGYQDQQALWDRNAFANNEDTQFLNAALDNNPVVPLKVGLGAALLLDPFDWLQLAVGTADADNEVKSMGFDTAFDGLRSMMAYFEAGARIEIPSPRGPLAGTYRVGGFVDGSRKEVFGRIDSSTGRLDRDRGHRGAYLSFDQLAFRELADPEQGLGLFARYGYADQDVNTIEHFWSLGFQYRGLLPGRDGDVLGLAMYQSITSDRLQERVDSDFGREIGVELYYRIALLPWLDVTPDAQFISNPGGRSSVRDAVVVVLRLRATF